MATDHVEGRAFWKKILPWAPLFRGFQVALDLNKLLLAAAGIVVMYLGWWLLAIIFTVNESPNPPAFETNREMGWAKFQQARQKWNLMHQAANLAPDDPRRWEVADLAGSEKEYEVFKGVKTGAQFKERVERLRTEPEFRKSLNVSDSELDEYESKIRLYEKLDKEKPRGQLSTAPWSEDRGPNPYLLVTGQAGIPWEAGHFWEWFFRDQFLVVIEPLVKFVRPVVYLFSPRADLWARFYFLCVTLWTIATWSLFGGAITRMAAVEIACHEKIGIGEALRYTLRRAFSYLVAPLCPLGLIFILLVVMWAFGVIHMIPFVGDFLSILLWPILILFGLVMAVTLVGLVSWPLMAATISTQGSDAWEAVSRAYTYVIQRPWEYLWYGGVAVVYGAILIFFVGLIGSLSVYLAEWGVARIQPESRDPAYLFIYAPTSFGWRDLLLHDAKTQEGKLVVHQGEIDPDAYQEFIHKDWHWWNTVGAVMVALVMGLIFLLVLGFGYSYFWTESTLIYMLLRRSVDTAELEEVYLEDEEQESPYGAPLPTPAPYGIQSGSPKPSQVPLDLVQSPAPAPPPSQPQEGRGGGEESPPPPPSPPSAPPTTSSAGPADTHGEEDSPPPPPTSSPPSPSGPPAAPPPRDQEEASGTDEERNPPGS
jgi:hypothetical protein